MEKCILVMDMPSSCEKCDLQNFGRCQKTKKSIVGTPSDLKRKPDWCPLKPMPDKKEDNSADKESFACFKLGYNACIDEILGGSEE